MESMTLKFCQDHTDLISVQDFNFLRLDVRRVN